MRADLVTIEPRDAIAILGGGNSERGERFAMAIVGFLASKPVNTRKTYQQAIKQFFLLWPGLSPDAVSIAHAAAFKKTLMQAGKSDATVYQRLSVMSALYSFLMKPSDSSGEQLVKSNPFTLVTRTDVKPTPYARSVPVEWTVFKKILDQMPTDVTGMRDRALLLFYAFSGRRRVEVARLRIRDLALDSDPKTYTARLKGGRIKTFVLPDICHRALIAYWTAAGRLGQLRPESGVITRVWPHGIPGESEDAPLSERMAAYILKRRAREAGFDWRQMKVHGLRHMAARDLNKAGARLQDIQEFLDHANPNTTAIYLGQLSGPKPSLEDQFAKVRDAAALIGQFAIDET
jgi:site-specific recombinase XerD